MHWKELKVFLDKKNLSKIYIYIVYKISNTYRKCSGINSIFSYNGYHNSERMKYKFLLQYTLYDIPG